MTEPTEGNEEIKEPATLLSDRLCLGPKLGQGGIGVVFEVHDGNLERTAALKMLRVPDEATSASARLLVHEARVTAALDHPGVVPVFELGVDKEGGVLPVGSLYFTMKRVEGQTLEAWLRARAGEPRSAKTLFAEVQVLLKVCDTIAFAHSRGVIHRDLKPGNIMLGQFGEVYVLDWGVARTQSEVGTGGLAGTFPYMAPEQARAQDDAIDERTDVFSLGAILFEMLSGEPPYVRDSSSITELRFKAMLADVPDVRTVSSWRVPTGLAEITRKALSRNRRDRYASVLALKEDLEDFLRSGWQFPKRVYGPGETIVREGEPGDTAFVVVRGRCQVCKIAGGQKVVLREMGPGEVFGEMAVFAEGPRTASVEALDEVTVLEISRGFLLEEEGLGYWLGRFIKALAERFRERDARATELEHRLEMLTSDPSAPRSE